MSYCKAIESMTGETLSLHKEYHDMHYGFAIEEDDELSRIGGTAKLKDHLAV